MIVFSSARILSSAIQERVSGKDLPLIWYVFPYNFWVQKI